MNNEQKKRRRNECVTQCNHISRSHIVHVLKYSTPILYSDNWIPLTFLSRYTNYHPLKFLFYVHLIHEKLNQGKLLAVKWHWWKSFKFSFHCCFHYVVSMCCGQQFSLINIFQYSHFIVILFMDSMVIQATTFERIFIVIFGENSRAPATQLSCNNIR